MNEEVYDSATKIWTSVFAAITAAIVDWFAVVAQVQHDPSREVVMGWWVAALVACLIPPIGWFVVEVRRRERSNAIAWCIICAALLSVQVLLLSWANVHV